MNKTLKFALKCILALLPAIILVGFIKLCPNCYMDEEYPAWAYTKDIVYNDGDDADVLILGDSRAMADLIPAILSGESPDADAGESQDEENTENDEKPDIVNLAVGGATPMEMYYFYASYLKNHDAPKTAVVMFAPFHYTYMDNYKTRTLYFNALKNSDYNELLKVALRYDSESVLFEDNAAYHLSCVLGLPDVYLPAIYNAHFTGRKADNDLRLSNLYKTKGQGYFGTDDGNADKAYEATYEEMEQSGDADLLTFYAGALFAMLSESCENVILIQPPMNETTYDNLNDNYVNQYRDYINNLVSGFSNITYSVDFERYDNEYFGDSSHLNEKGAVKYSEEFAAKYSEYLR